MNNLQKRLPVYSWLLKLYPRAYRDRYEKEMLLAASDMLDEAPNIMAKLVVRMRLATDLSLHVGKQRLIALGEQGFAQMPNYMKYNGFVSAILLLPFFVAFMANGLDKVFFNHTLRNSWLWQRPFIGLWIVYFPAIALLLATGSYVMYVAGRNGDGLSLLKRAIDFRHYWPVLLCGVAALGILFIVFFHDSGQCWIHAPWHTATHIKQTLQCTEDNRAGFLRMFQSAL